MAATYYDLVKYIKKYHVNWNTDLDDVLTGFYRGVPPSKPVTTPSQPVPPTAAPLFTPQPFHHPENGEYTSQDLFNLLST